MGQIAFTKISFITLILGFVLFACSKNSTGADPGPPDFSNYELMTPGLSYFEGNNANGDSTEYFKSGKKLALEFNGTINIGKAYLTFLDHIKKNPRDYSYKKEKWVWEFEDRLLGDSLSISVTAEEQDNLMIWEAFLMEEEASENTIEENKLFRGEVAKNDSLGNWTFYKLTRGIEPQKILLNSSWKRTGGISEENREINFIFFDDDESISESFVFERYDGNHYYFERTGQNGTASVYWNTAPGDGFYNVESTSAERKCWRLYRDFKNTDCSEITYRSR